MRIAGNFVYFPKAEVTKLSSHLHGRDANITRLGETCAEMEKQLREESQRRDKLDAELQIAAVNLQALRQHRSTTHIENEVIAPVLSNADKWGFNGFKNNPIWIMQLIRWWKQEFFKKSIASIKSLLMKWNIFYFTCFWPRFISIIQI